MTLWIQVKVPFSDLRTWRPAEADRQIRRPQRWVAPFGNVRIKGCSRLPGPYRSVPRLSSPLDAKASVRSPYALDRSQQNSCVGTVCLPAVRKAGKTPTHALCALMSSQESPASFRGSRTNPSIHNVIRQPGQARSETMSLTIAYRFLVEPDGIEPTTSCLQSTRSTN